MFVCFSFPPLLVSAITKLSLDRSFSFSETESIPDVRRLRGPWGSASETDLLKKAVVDELHQRFSSSESLNRTGMAGRYWVDPKRHRRAASISGLPHAEHAWTLTSTEDLRAKKSSRSIEVSAISNKKHSKLG